jgi:hypothetical protein
VFEQTAISDEPVSVQSQRLGRVDRHGRINLGEHVMYRHRMSQYLRGTDNGAGVKGARTDLSAQALNLPLVASRDRIPVQDCQGFTLQLLAQLQKSSG